MTFLRSLALCAVLAGAASEAVTPIEKVIGLIEGMKREVERDGQTEAQAYANFACFCKTTSGDKSKSVKDGNDKIDSLSADIAEKTANKNEASTELSTRRVKQETLSKELDETNTRCAKEKAEYNAEAADMNKALSSLKSAIKAMSDSKPKASLLQGAVKDDLMETLAVADAMNLVAAPKRQAITSMIQGKASVDPSDPEYGFHSNDIIDLLKNLKSDFQKSKATLDAEYGKAKLACDELKASLKKEMTSNTDAMQALDLNIEKLAKEIATHRGDLVESEADMKDDELYLKDLTAQCESRANDFDQRSSMRNDEVTALSAALKILKNDVKGAADTVNQRALLQKVQPKAAPAVEKPAPASSAAPKPSTAAKAVQKPVSFLQGFLASRSMEDRKEQALAVLTTEGQRLGSVVLTSLATRAAADPFKKVKGLIQKLIERLLAESAAEATKKGFCDTELGKSRKDRDFRRDETQELSADLERLEAKEDALTEEIKQLKKDLKMEARVMKETTSDRAEEKAANAKTLKTAKEGLDAVQEALLTLKVFYKQAAKASFVQASPVDEDTSGPGFSGNYKGNQSGSKAVFALLETIESDFTRTIKATENDEHQAHRDFVDFSQNAEMSIGSKTTKQELDEQDLKTTKTSLKTKMNDLVTAQKLLDDALKEIEELKPACIDTGMSFSERTKKREEEMAALKKAVCILDAEGVEPMCK